jgi:hypothetical protein
VIDAGTVKHVITLLEDRLKTVARYGAGGCPTCHDAELRGAIAIVRRLVEPASVRVESAAGGARPASRRRG